MADDTPEMTETPATLYKLSTVAMKYLHHDAATTTPSREAARQDTGGKGVVGPENDSARLGDGMAGRKLGGWWHAHF